ncbi:hypothetical protein SAMN02745944_05442 [Clostridium magnum DSM 2767]|nr:hypothetical protein SAMN02745944_05442 [Clostridium magnum DSM 2767]
MKVLAIYQIFIILCLLYRVLNGEDYDFKTKITYGIAWGSMMIFPVAYILE